MKLNVKKKDCKFIVKPEENVVICVINSRPDFDIKHLLVDFIYDNCPGDIDVSFFGNMSKTLKMPRTFTGKAVCSPDDEWDEELGKKIAYSRAKNKLYTSFFKRANIFIQTLDRNVNRYMDKFNVLGTVLDMNRSKLEEEIEDSLNK